MRKNMKRMAATLLACLCLLTVLPVPARAATGFSDVPASHWAAESITRAAKLGLVSGRSDGTFGLGQPMTRAAFVTVLCRLFQWELVSPASGSFPDNQDSAKWYYRAVETACLRGAVTQQEENFRPHDAITRQEMAVMLVRALGYGTLASLAGERKSPFTDVTSSLGYLVLANDLGIMTGNTRGAFQPDKTATREQAAAVLMRVYDKLNAQTPDVCGVARAANGLSLAGVGSVAVPAMKLVYNGSMQLTRDLSAEEAAAVFAAAEGKRRLMQVSGSSTGFADADTTALAEKIAAAAKKDGWDGVLLDIPKLQGTEKKTYSALVTALRAAMGTDSLLYVTAEAPSWQNATAYNGYDFAALAAQADKVILRAASYNQLVSDFPTSPQEPLEEVYYALETVAGAIPAEKRGLWLTATGTAWQGNMAIQDISAAKITQLQSSSGVTSYWSSRYAAPYLSYTESGVRMVVWYNDVRSAQARRQLLAFFGGGGLCISDLAGPLNGENGILTGLQ